MASSSSRWFIRILLVSILLGLLWIGYRSHQRSQPDYYWSRAEAAISKENWNAAKINLQNLIQRFPTDPRGHKAMASLQLQEAKLPETPESYARAPSALNLLVEAAKLREDDLPLQQLLVASALQAGRIQDAALAAQRVLKQEPRNADALYARACLAAERRDATGAMRALDQLPPERQQTYRVLALRLQVLQQRDPKDPKVQETLESIVARAGQMAPDAIKALPAEESGTLTRLLSASVATAKDVDTAYRRAAVATTVAENMSSGSPPASSSPVVKMMAEIAATLHSRFPSLALQPETEALRQQFTGKLARLLPAKPPTDDKKTDLLIAYEAALVRFNQGDFQGALELLNHAIKQQQSLKGARSDALQPLELLAARANIALRRFRDAKANLAAVLKDKQSTGIGQLLLGAIASAEGRHQDALDHYTIAERELGSSPLVHISLAQTHMALGQWSEALPHLSALHALIKTDNAELQAWLAQQQLTEARLHLHEARACLALGKPEDAAPHLQALAGTEFEPQATLLQADYLAVKQDLAGAEQLLEAARSKKPDDPALVARQVAILASLKKTKELSALLTASAQAAPDDVQLQLVIARAWAGMADYDEALKVLNALEEKHPNIIPIKLLKADLLTKSDKPADAKAVLDDLQKQADTGAMGGILSALLAARANDPQAALTALKAAPELGSENLQTRYLEGELAAFAGDFREAIAAFGETIRVTNLQQRAGALLIYSAAKLAEKEGAAEAESALTPLVNRLPNEPFVLMAHSDVLTMGGKFDEALKQLDRLQSLEKKSPLPPYLKAVVLSRAKEPTAALAEAKEAIRLDPKFLPALTFAAQAQFDAKAYDDSLRSLDAALALAPKAWNLMLLRTEVLWATNHQADAIKQTREIVANFPEVAEARRHLVTLQARARQRESYEQALRDCQEGRTKFPKDAALSIQEIVLLRLVDKPEDSDAQAKLFLGEPIEATKAVMLIQAFAQAQQYAAAKQWADVALAGAKPDDVATLHHVLGMTAMREQATTGAKTSLEVARRHFTEAVKSRPKDVLSANNLAWMLAVDFNEPEEAAKIVDQSLSAIPVDRLPVTMVDTMAVVYRKAKQYAKAAALLEATHKVHPEVDLITFHLGMTLGHVDRYSEARRHLEAALAGTLTTEQQAEAKQELERVAGVEAALAAKRSLEKSAQVKPKPKSKVAGAP